MGFMSWAVTGAVGAALLVYGLVMPAYWCEDFDYAPAARKDGGCVALWQGREFTTKAHRYDNREFLAPGGALLLVVGAAGMYTSRRKVD